MFTRKSTISQRLLLPACILLCFAVACNKDKNETKSKTEILTTGKWKITAHNSNPAIDWNLDGTPDSDIYALYDNCTKDDYYVFMTNNNVEGNEGPTKCDPSDPQTFTFTWALADNETTLILDGERASILELNNNTLKLKTEDSPVQTLTFTHF